jgi:urease gamma subunit
VHLLNQSRITGETAGVQVSHLVDQGLQLLACFRTVLHGGPNLVQKVKPLINLALRVGRIRTLLGRRGGAGNSGVARIVSTIAIGPITPSRTAACRAITDVTRQASATLTALPSLSLLSALTNLPPLTLLATLPALARLAARAAHSGLCLSLLLAIALLTIALLTIARGAVPRGPAQTRNLIPQP